MSKRTTLLLLIIFIHSSHSRNDKNNAIPESKVHINLEDSGKRHHQHNDDETTEHVPRHHHRYVEDGAGACRQNQNQGPVEITSSRLQLFEQTDADQDGFVTREEYTRFNNLQDNHTTDIEDLFMAYDRDNDEKLSEDEFVDQSSPWDVMTECDFLVMRRCNTKLDQSMSEADSDLEEPICSGLQSYLDCIVDGQENGESCDIESYITSVKQTALVLRSSGLCPNLEIGKTDFEIEIDYEPKDDIPDEYVYDEDKDYSSDSTSSSSVMRPNADRYARNVEETASEEVNMDIESRIVQRKCSSSALLSCVDDFEARITEDTGIKSNLERYRQCVSDKTDLCGPDKQNLLIRESLKILANKQIANVQPELTKYVPQTP